MRSIALLPIAILALNPECGFAQRGWSSEGKCVSPCSRDGGRPCPPCLPAMIGPSSFDWAKAIPEMQRQNSEFKLSIDERAKSDFDYRSREYVKDLKQYHESEGLINNVIGSASVAASPQ